MWLFLEAVPEPGGLGSLLGTLLLPIAMIGVLYFLMIRPESKRKKKAAQMRNDLIVGDSVTTIGGVTGKVVNIKDDQITVETGADKVRIKFMRWAISSKGEQISE
ncbi:MAG: preprotein translocase subunit YajC [Oscillospiraceae bacterium]|nr:preprotein translocase subunit YajC [Oscillospiraceae bacterium]